MVTRNKGGYRRFIVRIYQVLLILFISLTIGRGVAAKRRQLIVSSTDKASIISCILSREIVANGMSDANQALYLSTQNIAEALTTGLTPSNLIVLTPDQIQQVGLQKNGFHYLRFTKLEVNGQRVHITLVRDTVKDGSEGTKYQCTRRSGRWICRGIEGFNISS